ncbi:metallopeptidase family protein [Sorangium sp. So ce233]|uniref:metallopeptidase family protein n=1 Tax=Sorangium sp. So ce233 TaxID=3133290 RepID=UPI003F604D1A
MPKPAPAQRLLPAQVHLPSGNVVRLSDAAARTHAPAVLGAPESRGGDAPAPIGRCARDVQILAGPSVLADARGAPLDPLGLPLADAHVLRALLAFAGVAPEEPGAYTCENCGAPFEVAPSSLLEIGPFTDGELDDPELDRPFDFGALHPIPALRVGRAVCRGVRLVERTVEEAMPLLRLPSEGALRVTPSLVVAMGIAALGRERRAPVIADALARAPDEAWAAIVDLYHEARYPARLFAVHRCQACGARNDLDVPLERELARAPLRAPEADPDAPGEASSAAGEGRAFPDLDAFEARVRAAAERIYAARGVRNIDLFIDAGVPACDDGGEPLLGCYTPGTPADELGIARPPEIRIFYRTFRTEAREDPGFDVDAEIDETIDHEVIHHLHHLAGSDPLDDEEHEQIERENLRRIGHAEAARRARRGALSDVAGFLRATWPAWLIAAVGTAIAWCEGGR